MQEFCMQIFAHARDSILQLHAGQLVNAWKHDHRCGDVLLGVSSFRVRIFLYIYIYIINACKQLLLYRALPRLRGQLC